MQCLPLELQKRGEKKPIGEEEAEGLVKELRLKAYKECSAMTGQGLKGVFDEALMVGLSGEEIVIKKRLCSLL